MQRLHSITYVLHLPFDKRSALAKFWISAHSLAIEKGRYSRPRICPEDRICIYCSSNEVEDESHVLNICTAYDNERKDFINKLSGFTNYSAIPIEDRFSFLMNNSRECDIAHTVSEFLIKIFKKREGTVND